MCECVRHAPEITTGLTSKIGACLPFTSAKLRAPRNFNLVDVSDVEEI